MLALGYPSVVGCHPSVVCPRARARQGVARVVRVVVSRATSFRRAKRRLAGASQMLACRGATLGGEGGARCPAID